MYSEAVLTFASGASHEGVVGQFTHEAVSGEPGEGAFIRIALCLELESISCARFETYSCPAAKACSEIVCRVAETIGVENVETLTAKDVIVLLGGLPEGKHFLADMAVQTLKRAVRQPLDPQGAGPRG
ncbi:MAG: iron-sulfur cluster assembly scaffold protein [Armatimonadetes bacterium]|nr:iron-sulfur cluster assembly scaffold protein [Armatimonadota bacterium]